MCVDKNTFLKYNYIKGGHCMYYIDLGSSTIKTYSYNNKKVEMIEEYSIYFKNGFTQEYGISNVNTRELFEYFLNLKAKYNLSEDNTKIFVTGIFRNLNDQLKSDMEYSFKEKTDLTFNIISHDTESYYLEKAMEGDYNNKKVMIINMGGKTTEILSIQKGIVIKSQNVSVGVAELLNKFPEINNKYSTVKIEDIVNYTNTIIEHVELDKDYDCAIFTGGELRFEKLTGYNLIPNNLFKDDNHPYMVTYEDFVKGNEKILYNLTLQDLYDLMPHNPKWMDGARAGAILPQAIFDKAGIKVIIPSDLNLINGVIKDIESNI